MNMCRNCSDGFSKFFSSPKNQPEVRLPPIGVDRFLASAIWWISCWMNQWNFCRIMVDGVNPIGFGYSRSTFQKSGRTSNCNTIWQSQTPSAPISENLLSEKHLCTVTFGTKPRLQWFMESYIDLLEPNPPPCVLISGNEDKMRIWSQSPWRWSRYPLSQSSND